MKDTQNQISIFDSDPDSKLHEFKNSVEQLQTDLSKYGLTGNQSKVYIYLGKYGSKTAPEVCKALGLPRTETYHLLTSLQNKGIVSATFQHPIKFKALPLTKAIWTLVNTEKERVKGLERQEKIISELWEKIPEFHGQQEEDTEDKFQMLEGPNQINSKISELIDNAESEVMILGSEKDFLKLYHGDYLEPLHKSKTNYKFLSSCSDKTLYIFDDVDRTNVRKLNKDVEEILCFIVKDNSEVLFFMKNASTSQQKMSAMWTDSKAMVCSMMMLFNCTWSKSKNIHL